MSRHEIYDELADKVIARMEKSDVRRINSELAALFEVSPSMMRTTIERMMRAGTVVSGMRGNERVYFAAKWQQAAVETLPVRVFKPCTHKISVLGNRPGSNDYLEWESKYI